MARPDYRFSDPKCVDGISIFSQSGLTHEWFGGFNTKWPDMMRSRCGLLERLTNLETTGSLGRCTKCAKRRKMQPHSQDTPQHPSTNERK